MLLRAYIPILTFAALAIFNAKSASAGGFLCDHQTHRYGTFNSTYEDVWKDLSEDVYQKGKLNDLYQDRCHLFDLGQGLWACPGCRYAPLHYETMRQSVLTPQTPYAGASWYQGTPIGQRTQNPLASGPYHESQRVP
jgi:hypothetical protein